MAIELYNQPARLSSYSGPSSQCNLAAPQAMSAASSSSPSSSPTSLNVSSEAVDQLQELNLTLLSLPPTPLRPPSPPLHHPHSSPSEPSLPISTSSWVDLSSIPSSSEQGSPSTSRPRLSRNNDQSQRRRKRKPVRAGLSSLANPPSPFGSQLGAQPPLRRSTPYHHSHSHDYFNPNPTARQLSVENLVFPRADPDEVYHTALSALHSVKKLVIELEKKAADVLTAVGKYSVSGQLTKLGLVACVCLRPRWILYTINFSFFVLRQPFRAFRSTLYVFVMANYLVS